jgi:hypothetical protein
MRLLISSSILALLITTARGQGIGVGTAEKPNFEAAVLTTATSVVGTDSQNWAYVVWNSPGASTLAGKAFSVHLQSVPAGPFTRQAIIGPVTDVPALGLLIDRAAKLGANNAELDVVLRDLLRKKSWGGTKDANGKPVSSFDAQPLVRKLSAVMGRAMQSTEGLAAVQAAAPAHPALRMALGRAWAGPLPAGAGPMTIEVREFANGSDGSVLGRVSITPGQGISLPSPGKIVQVPDLKPSGDLTIKLRWAVPDALRRLQQHVLGFRVYRILDGDEGSLTLESTPQQIHDFSVSNPNDVRGVNDAPVPIGKLYTDADVGGLNFSGDPEVFFIADDGNRGQPMSEAPNAFLYPGLRNNLHAFYFVRAVDLLGNEGPPSMLCEGIAVRTIPPDVPSGLEVTELPIGPGGATRFRLRWRANAAPATVDDRTTERYAIYRGDVPQFGPSSLNYLESPGSFQFATPIAIVNHSTAVDSYLTYVDEGVQKNSENTDRSIWYAVTALHDTPLDSRFALFAPLDVHKLVQSAPSAPAFGVFRDRTGPAAPTGGVYVNCGKLITLKQPPVTTAPRDIGNLNDQTHTHLRLVCTRQNRAVVSARFTIVDLGNPAPVGLIWDTQNIFFPPGKDEIVYEISLTAAQSDSLAVNCLTTAADGCLSIIATTLEERPSLNASQWNVFRFLSGRFAATDFASDSASPVADLATVVPFESTELVSPGVRKGVFAAAEGLNGQTVVLQRKLAVLGDWSTFATAQVANDEIVFNDATTDLLFFQHRAAKLPAGGDCVCVHDARPVGEEEIQPITVFMNVPETSREWRIYRSVDAGPLALVKSGISGGPLGSLNDVVSDVILADKAMPPNGALMRYFGQCFDQNNNPSPLKFLAEVSLLPAPATPMLNVPTFEEPTPGTPVVRLKWFCPVPGVQRFRVTLVPVDAPLNVNEGSPQSPGGITRVPYALFEGKPLQSMPYQLVGEKETKFAPVSHAFDLPPVIGDGPPLHEATFLIAKDQPYIAWISAIGHEDVIVTESRAYPFEWKAPPLAPGPEPLVPWPARPLPPIVSNPLGDPFLMSDVTFPNGGGALAGFIPNRSSVSNADAANLYPVGIRIGALPSAPEIRVDLSDPYGLTPPVTFDAQIGTPSNPPLNTNTDPTTYVLPGMLPGVLFRQTMLASGDPGALVQVSPLRENIAYQRASISTESVISYASFLRDPFIKYLTYDVSGTLVTWVNLVDTHSVEAGATYRYYLVNYGPNGEISKVWDCGQITIPED